VPFVIKLLTALGLIACFGLIACYSPPLGQEGTNVAVVRQLLEGVDNGDLALFDQLCAPRYAYHAAGEAEPRDCAGHKRAAREFAASFSNRSHTVEDIFAAGDRVVLRFTQSGTHTGEFLGIPPTGAEVKFRTMGMIQFVNGKMLHAWLDMDWPTLFDQLGTTPPAWHRRWVERMLDPLPPETSAANR
jgi:predicted ester cyclase